LEQLVAGGVKADLLFTDCEEMGMTTVTDFVPPRQYRFALAMDRAGSDTVLYQYEEYKQWEACCRDHLGPLGMGTYSDIVDAEDALGCAAVNVGVGYHKQHTPKCWADLRMTRRQMARVAAFIPHALRAAPDSFTSQYGWLGYGLAYDVADYWLDRDMPPATWEDTGGTTIDAKTGRVLDCFEEMQAVPLLRHYSRKRTAYTSVGQQLGDKVRSLVSLRSGNGKIAR
jgi:hypothetical protein